MSVGSRLMAEGFRAQGIGYIECVVYYRLACVGGLWGEDMVALALPVDIELIEADSGNIGCGAAYLLSLQLYLLAQIACGEACAVALAVGVDTAVGTYPASCLV